MDTHTLEGMRACTSTHMCTLMYTGRHQLPLRICKHTYNYDMHVGGRICEFVGETHACPHTCTHRHVSTGHGFHGCVGSPFWYNALTRSPFLDKLLVCVSPTVAHAMHWSASAGRRNVQIHASAVAALPLIACRALSRQHSGPRRTLAAMLFTMVHRLM